MNKIIIPDISFYQDADNTPRGVDFAQMHAAGALGVIIRAGQNTWTDPDVAYNMREAKKAGLLRGSYFFYDSRVSPETQLNTWVRGLNGDVPELGLWMDFEESYNGGHGKEAHFQEFARRVEAEFKGVELGVYTGYYWWMKRVKNYDFWSKYPLWIATYYNYDVWIKYPLSIATHYTEKPKVPPPWGENDWTFWQFTDQGDGKLYGAESKEIDLNYFNGDAGEWARRFGGGEKPTPEPKPTTIQVTITRQDNGKSVTVDL